MKIDRTNQIHLLTIDRVYITWLILKFQVNLRNQYNVNIAMQPNLASYAFEEFIRLDLTVIEQQLLRNF